MSAFLQRLGRCDNKYKAGDRARAHYLALLEIDEVLARYLLIISDKNVDWFKFGRPKLDHSVNRR
jgi:hypothetical protein